MHHFKNSKRPINWKNHNEKIIAESQILII